jgi:hypothetical protein
VTKPLELLTTGDDLSELWSRIDGLRKGTTAVKIEPELLKNFLLDHGKLFDHYNKTKDT